MDRQTKFLELLKRRIVIQLKASGDSQENDPANNDENRQINGMSNRSNTPDHSGIHFGGLRHHIGPVSQCAQLAKANQMYRKSEISRQVPGTSPAAATSYTPPDVKKPDPDPILLSYDAYDPSVDHIDANPLLRLHFPSPACKNEHYNRRICLKG